MIHEIFNSLERHCDKFEHYFPLYERHFNRFVGTKPKILEIGVQYGGSAEMWRKYFGEGTIIHGVDIAPQCSETDYLKLFVGDQGDPEFWKTEFRRKKNFYDIVIDDGSHDNPHQIVTLLECFNMIRDGGVFWCEDTHTSYYHNVRVRDGGYKNSRSFTEFTKNIIDVINHKHTESAIGVGKFDGPKVPSWLISNFVKTQGIHFYDSIIVIEKGKPLKFKRIIK